MTGLLLLMATSTWREVDRNMGDTRGKLQYIRLCVYMIYKSNIIIRIRT